MNKIDSAGSENNQEALAKFFERTPAEFFRVSALTGEGIEPLIIPFLNYSGNKKMPMKQGYSGNI